MDKFEEKSCLCALQKIFGFEPRVALALIEEVGSATGVFALPEKELDILLGPFSRHRTGICRKTVDDCAEELQRLSSQGAMFLGVGEEGYPDLLRECGDPPLGFYWKGVSTPEETFNRENMVAIVGTRDISSYGTEWCRRIVGALPSGKKAPTIVSGLALGTDVTAHGDALERGLPTIGVMATGIDDVYPRRHRAIAERMASTPLCALVTDYPPGTEPVAFNFLRRNRIIAGMSRACILVESKIRGGGMMTANLAFSYGRDVYALPGRVDDVRSQGCNQLIGERVAEAVTDEMSLVRSLGMKASTTGRGQSTQQTMEEKYAGKLDAAKMSQTREIFGMILHNRGIRLDDLARECGLPYGLAADICGMLEADGLVTVDLLRRCTVNRSF